MKRWIATILSISLVIGLAAVLHACGKPEAEPTATTEPTTQSDGTDGESVTNSYAEFMSELYSEYADDDYSYTERSTDAHYQQEYDALTLPRAVTTQAVAGTTKAQTTTDPAHRETTTQFQFTSPSTTKKSSGATTKPSGDTTKKPATTAAQQTQSVEEPTTMLADVVGGNVSGAVKDVTVMPRPQVTYLDKYVLDIVESGSYTAQMEMKEDGMTMQITTYVDGDDWASEIPIGGMMAQEMGLPSSLGVGTMRFIIKDTKTNPKAYIVMPTGGYMEMSDIAQAAEMMGDAGAQDLRRQMQLDRLEYCGKTTGVGYVCESYILADENIRYDFYFTQTDNYTGLVRWDISDLTTKEVVEQVVMRLYKGVTNKNAFKVSGKKYTEADFAGLFGE